MEAALISAAYILADKLLHVLKNNLPACGRAFFNFLNLINNPYERDLVMRFLNRLIPKLITPTVSMILMVSVIIILTSSKNAFAVEAKPSANGFAIALIGQYKALNNELQNNPFKRQLVLKSTESSDALKGEIYVVLDYPFEQVNSAINNPDHWCDALILHVNVKYCRAAHSNAGTVLDINLGKKYEQPLAETYDTKFNYENITTTANYFSVEMKAAEGPLSTKDYRIWVEATPINNKQTFLHFTYTYSFGLTGRLAMNAYLATLGKNKVGFSIASMQANGEPNYIQGVRGVVERNTMRYYLAIDAYLATLKNPVDEQFEKRLEYWFESTQQYATQLHEVEKADYLSMKRNEAERQHVNK